MLLNSDANIKDINLLLAIKNTFNKRNTLFDIREFKEIIEIIKESDKLRKVYNDYQLSYLLLHIHKFSYLIIPFLNFILLFIIYYYSQHPKL